MDSVFSQLKDIIVTHVKQIQSAQDLGDDLVLQDAGLDSMSAMNLLFDLEDQFDVSFDDSLLTPEVFKSPKTLYDALQTLI